MSFIENDLEEIVFTASYEFLKERGLSFYVNDRAKRYRQLKLGNYGRSDIIIPEVTSNRFAGVRDWKITVVELKKDKVSVSAFLQAVRYSQAVKQYLHKRFGYDNHVEIRIVLIGKRIDMNSDVAYLPNVYDGKIRLVEYQYRHDGIHFNDIRNVALKQEGF